MSFKDFLKKSVLNAPGKAKKTLEGRGIQYSENSFVECIRQGKLEDVHLFLEAGMNPNARGADQRTAVQHAVSSNQPAALDALVRAGADATVKDNDGNSLLIQAILQRNEEMARALIAAGAQVDARNNAGFSAAMLCARENQAGIAEALLKAGADVLVKNHASGESALITAAKSGHTRLVELMLRNAITSEDRDATDKTGATALWWAAHNGHLDSVRYLCSKKADVNLANGKGETPLQAAERNGHGEIVQELLNAGASRS